MLRLTVLLALLCLLTGLATAQVRFAQAFYAVSGDQAIGEVSADLDRDGRPDLAVGTNGAVDIFFNLGSGKFGNRVSYGTAGSAGQLLATDVNNDGWPDLLFVDFEPYGNTSLDLLLNNGNGTFRNGSSLPTSMGPQNIAAGDLNRDGRLDVVALECDYDIGKCQFEVLKGSGAGAFTRGQILALANKDVSGPILADVSRDGKLDLINTRDPKLFVWRGNGDGTFATPASYQPPPVCSSSSFCGDTLESVTVGDFNNDASLDIAVQQAHLCGSACGDNTEYLYRNNGSGSFTLVGSFRGMGTAGGFLTVTDLNGDQNMDLINTNGDHFGCSNVYALGKGNFTFGSQYSLGGCESSDLVARDFNLDSRHDLAVSTWLGGGWTAMINTSAYTNCAPPSSSALRARICSPGAGATVASPVLLKASGNSPAGVQRLEVWVDGVKKYEKWNDQLARRISMSAGSHRVTVVAVDQYKGASSTSVTLNVQ